MDGFDKDALASPIAAVKYAQLTQGSWRRDWAIFVSVYGRLGHCSPYSRIERAVCEKLADHLSPATTCTCGFHAVKSRDDLVRLGERRRSWVELDVTLWGQVIEHEFGWRAQYQRVDAVRIDTRCGWCGDDVIGMRPERRGLLVGACGRCMGRHSIGLDDIGDMLGVLVYAAVLEPATRRRLGRRERSTGR